MKILNLYCCLGGNRYKWGDKHEITAVELDPELARMYQERFPNDTVIIGDAHAYLLAHYKEFDFIWSSPPCPTHSKTNTFLNAQGVIRYPDMQLYQEVIFLHHFYKGIFCIENVKPYYNLLIPAQIRGRHVFWSNFKFPSDLNYRTAPTLSMQGDKRSGIKVLSKFHQIDLSDYKGNTDKRKIARNLVDFEAGKTILDQAERIFKSKQQKQGVLNFEL